MCLQFQTSTSTCHLHSHVSQMPQWCLARDSDPTSLVCLVSKPHRPVGAQQELRLFLLWGWGDIVYNQRCPPWSLHSERRWDGAVGLGHWKRSRLPRPPRGHPSHLPLPQPQSHSVSSWPRFSQLRPSRPLPPMQPPVLCAGVTTASWLPSVFPRGGSPQTVSSERSL